MPAGTAGKKGQQEEGKKEPQAPENGVIVSRDGNGGVLWGVVGQVDPLLIVPMLRRAARDAEATLGVG